MWPHLVAKGGCWLVLKRVICCWDEAASKQTKIYIYKAGAKPGVCTDARCHKKYWFSWNNEGGRGQYFIEGVQYFMNQNVMLHRASTSIFGFVFVRVYFVVDVCNTVYYLVFFNLCLFYNCSLFYFRKFFTFITKKRNNVTVLSVAKHKLVCLLLR